VLREIYQKGEMNSTREVGPGIGTLEKERGRGTVVVCSSLARLGWTEKEKPETVRWGLFAGNLIGHYWSRQGQKLEGGLRGLYRGGCGAMSDDGEGYTDFAWGRSRLYLERAGYLRYCRNRISQ
jgi:hypothetical protein